MINNANAEKEWKALKKETVIKMEERTKELDNKGVKWHLDGKDHFKDIEDWYIEKTKELQKKYFNK